MPMTGKPGPAEVLAIGVRQQSVYQRKTLLERRRDRMASVPAVSFTRPGGIWKMSVPPAGSSTSDRSRKPANASGWARAHLLQIAERWRTTGATIPKNGPRSAKQAAMCCPSKCSVLRRRRNSL